MFDSSLISEDKNAFFHYINAKGEVSQQSVTRVVERDEFFQGYSINRKAFRTFRKDRVLKMFMSEDELLNATLDKESIVPKTQPRPSRKLERGNSLEICFTGFKQADKTYLTELAKNNNLSVKGGVSANLYFLCVGDNMGWRKIEEARARNAFIISKEQFITFIETGEIPYEAPELDVIHEEKITSEVDSLKKDLEALSLTFRTLREPRRSTALIANFIDGYAAGWKFAIKEVFKSKLDIKLTKITFEKNTYDVWTQGTSYQFQRGDTFYSDKLGYTDWSEFLKLPHAMVLQIKYDCFSGYETIASFEGSFTGDFNPNRLITPRKLTDAPILMESQSYDPGTVTVEFLTPDETKKRLITISTLSMTQDDFISLLQSGCYWERKSEQVPKLVDLFNYDRS